MKGRGRCIWAFHFIFTGDIRHGFAVGGGARVWCHFKCLRRGRIAWEIIVGLVYLDLKCYLMFSMRPSISGRHQMRVN